MQYCESLQLTNEAGSSMKMTLACSQGALHFVCKAKARSLPTTPRTAGLLKEPRME